MLKVWSDKKRYFGMPISFTNYSMSMDRLFIESGLLTRTEEQLLLYRVRDISTSISLFQRLFGVGTVKVLSSDKTNPEICLKNIKTPKNVSELIHKHTEMAKKERGMRVGEIMESSDVEFDEMDIDA